LECTGHQLAGTLHFRDYSSYIEDLKRGEMVVFEDATKDPRTAEGAQTLKAISAQAVVNMPVTEHGGFVALLYLNHATPRAWKDEEIMLISEVAQRTRTAVAGRTGIAGKRKALGFSGPVGEGNNARH
jgi:GAF domain-containing protein